LHLRKKSRDNDKPLGLLSSSTIEEKNLKNDNEPKSWLPFSTTEKKEKKTKDNDELESQIVVVFCN
jgi:hypothetical protein